MGLAYAAYQTAREKIQEWVEARLEALEKEQEGLLPEPERSEPEENRALATRGGRALTAFPRNWASLKGFGEKAWILAMRP